MRKKMYKSQNGSISMFVMVAMAFFLTTIIGVYVISGKRAQTQTESLSIVKEQYYTEGEEEEKYYSKISNSDKIPIYTKEQLWSIGEKEFVEIEGEIYNFSKTDLTKYELKNDIVINIDTDLKNSKFKDNYIYGNNTINKNNFKLYYYYQGAYYVPVQYSDGTTTNNLCSGTPVLSASGTDFSNINENTTGLSGKYYLFGYAYTTLASQITANNYGEYVDLGTSLIVNDNITLADGTYPKTDWRIFHKDTNGTWLILADYLPYSNESALGTGLANEGSTYPYSWKSTTSRNDLLTRLEDSTAWNKLLSSEYTSKGIKVTGAIELETYKESWNAKGYTTMYLAGDDTNGYYVGASANPTTTYYNFCSDVNGYSDTLYYPNKNDPSRVIAYWLASPSADYASYVMYVNFSGSVGCDGGVYYNGYDHYNYGVRPAVYLPADIQLKYNPTTEVWEIK